MGLIKQSTTESFQKDDKPGLDVPTISPIANRKVGNFEDAKSHRILMQGILQAVIQSQGLLLEPNNGYINKVKETTLDLVKFVEENSK